MVLHIHDPELTDFIQYIDSLKNYERSGVPKDAGTDSDDGFDLGRMRRLMDCLECSHCWDKRERIHSSLSIQYFTDGRLFCWLLY